MAASTVVKHLYDGQIDVEDGTTPTPVSLTVPFTVGDLSLSGYAETQRGVTAYTARGVLTSVRHTDRTFVTGSFSAQLADISDGTDNTLVDFLTKQGSYASNVSTLGASAEVYGVKITLTVEGTDLGDSADHTIVLDDCVCTVDISEGEPNTVTVNFTCYGTISLT